MDNTTFLGYLVIALISLGSFITLIVKFTQPINDLRVVIQKLNDNIEAIKDTNKEQSDTLKEHGEHLTRIDGKIGVLETKVNMYHPGDGH